MDVRKILRQNAYAPFYEAGIRFMIWIYSIWTYGGDTDLETLDKIKRLQTNRGWNNAQLASEANIARSTISSMFTRNSTPTNYTLSSICSAFDMTVEEFYAEGYIPSGLTSKEARLLESFKEFSDDAQESFIHLFEDLVRSEKASGKHNKKYV